GRKIGRSAIQHIESSGNPRFALAEDYPAALNRRVRSLSTARMSVLMFAHPTMNHVLPMGAAFVIGRGFGEVYQFVGLEIGIKHQNAVLRFVADSIKAHRI